MKQKQAGFGLVEIILVMLVLTIAIGVGVYTLRARLLHKQAPVDNQLVLTKKLFRTFESVDTNFTVSYPEHWRVDDKFSEEQAIYFRKSEYPLPYLKLAKSLKSPNHYCDSNVTTTLKNVEEAKIGTHQGYSYYVQNDNEWLRIRCFELGNDVYTFSYGFENGEEHLHAVEFEKFTETFTFENQ